MGDDERLDAETLMALVEPRGDGPHVSLYAPMIKAGPETRQNPIRFKNLLREAREALEGQGVAGGDADALLEPLSSRVDDHEFFQHQETGLAMFVAEGFARSYRLPLELPELVVVTSRFHLKPLLAHVGGDGVFHVLALSQNAVRLLECSRDAEREIALGEQTPRSLADALGRELSEQQLQLRTPNRDQAIYHAQGAGEDDLKPEIRKFLGMVDAGLAERIGAGGANGERPLVVAAVEALAAMYREASDRRRIVGQIVAGNPEHRSERELREAAWPLVEPVFDRERRESVERFGQARADGTGSIALDEVVVAAIEGRVDTLFVPLGVRRWGRVDVDARHVEEREEPAPGDEDLIDRAAVATLGNGGRVFAVAPEAMPAAGPVAAIYRY